MLLEKGQKPKRRPRSKFREFGKGDLDAIALGYYVLPLHSVLTGDNNELYCSCGKRDCGRNAGKHPQFKDGAVHASMEQTIIHKWWYRWPEANLGLATGVRSGLVVLDIDSETGGFESLAALENQYGPLPPTVKVKTRRSGAHYYFKLPDTVIISSALSVIGPGIDILGENGHVVAPPSDGYNWDYDRPFTSLAALPQWIIDALSKDKEAGCIPLENIKENRKAEIVWWASSLRRLGYTFGEIRLEMHRINEQHCTPPLSSSYIEGVVGYVCAIMSREWPLVLLRRKFPIDFVQKHISPRATTDDFYRSMDNHKYSDDID